MSNALAIEYLRGELANYEQGMYDGGGSPDGYAATSIGAKIVRKALALLEPEAWCPPHYYAGMATNTPGECQLTCQVCGDSFVGTWDQEGYHGRARATGELGSPPKQP